MVHAAALFTEFRKQKPGENLRNYIADYVRLMKEATEKTPKEEYDITAKLHFLHRLANGYLAAKILPSRLFHNYRRFSLNEIMEQVVAMESDYQVGELFTGDVSQIMGIEKHTMTYPLVIKMGPQGGPRPSIIATNVERLVISKKIVLGTVMSKTWNPNTTLLGRSPTLWKHKPL